jgi:hypothetical protein
MNATRNKWQEEIVDGVVEILDALLAGKPGALVYFVPGDEENEFTIMEATQHKSLYYFCGTHDQAIDFCREMEWRFRDMAWCARCKAPCIVDLIGYPIDLFCVNNRCECGGELFPELPQDVERPR